MFIVVEFKVDCNAIEFVDENVPEVNAWKKAVNIGIKLLVVESFEGIAGWIIVVFVSSVSPSLISVSAADIVNDVADVADNVSTNDEVL